MSKVKKEKIEEPKIPYGIVAYTDGGARPNPGYAGWGIHAYVYTKNEPKKGNGHATQRLTKSGYVPKLAKAQPDAASEADSSAEADEKAAPQTKKEKEVEVTHYWDISGGIVHPATNNIAEICAAQEALTRAKELGVKEVTIVADSKLVVSSLTGWLDSWEKSDWKKSNGLPVANQEYFKQLKLTVDDLKASGCKIKSTYIPAHQDLPGNTQADQYATMGVKRIKQMYPDLASFMTLPKDQSAVFVVEANLSQAQGYWSPDTLKPGMLSLPGMVFWTDANTIQPGEYYMCSQLKDEELYGSKSTDAAAGYVLVKQPIEQLEELRRWHTANAHEDSQIIIGYVHRLYEASVVRMRQMFGDLCISKDERENSQVFVDGVKLSKENKPWRQSVNLITHVNKLKGLLLAFQKASPDVTVTDITQTLYDITPKGYKLKPYFVVGLSNYDTDINYTDASGVLKSARVNLHLGIDLVTRQSLKAFESQSPKVWAITWMEGEKMFRYATVIEAEGDVGIWSAMFANTRFLD